MRKPAFCIFENKDADQLRSNCAADQRLCFRYTDSTIPLLPRPLAILCGCIAWFVLDLVGNPEDRFSHNGDQMLASVAEQAGFSLLVGDTPMQYTPIFQGCKNDNFQMKKCNNVSYFCSRHCGYTLEPPR